MARMAFVMKLKPGCEEIYKRKHDEIWPELVESMKRRGTRNYSIYRHGLMLFAYLETDNTSRSSPPYEDVTLRWWKEMEPYMEYNDDGTPWREPLPEMFHLD
jgi:L-rhamnose mutarotase